MRLYHANMTRGFRPRWLLEETGADFELVTVNVGAGEQRRPEYLAIHPLGALPALDDEGVIVLESSAICMHLADRFPEAELAPTKGTPESAAYYQWIAYAVCTIEPLVTPVYMRGFRVSKDERHSVATDEERQKLNRVLAPMLDALGDRDFLVGAALSTADIITAGVLLWADSVGLLQDSPRAKAYLDSLAARDAFQRALQ